METIVEAVYVLDGGTLDVEASTIVPGSDFGTRLLIPVQMFLVKTRMGYILIDAGNDPGCIQDPEKTWGPDLASAVIPHMTDANHPYAQLALLGLDPTDIKMVIYTHLHHDHCGAARLFPEAVHVVQQAEYRWAFYPDRYASRIYLPSDFGSEDIRWKLAEGDWLILPGIHLFSTPGHTPGHQSVVLWGVPDCGTFIIAGDAVYCKENVRRDLPPGITTDAVQATRSLHRLTALAHATDGSLLVSHDAESFATLPKPPEPLSALDLESRRFYIEGERTLYGEGIISNFMSTGVGAV
ncbi:N-acyl homoserine lactonase family protein [Mycolicibacterium palauense]|uniref:N-acyl homoserine lactonase family protein n=1 Tax=Mycolicibacterium palauense TaxID=2034511 RepID=UPI000BFEFEEC|nr:N-acyl homoserine lactonase family protein [Mycolicibacterium palauense]